MERQITAIGLGASINKWIDPPRATDSDPDEKSPPKIRTSVPVDAWMPSITNPPERGCWSRRSGQSVPSRWPLRCRNTWQNYKSIAGSLWFKNYDVVLRMQTASTPHNTKATHDGSGIIEVLLDDWNLLAFH